VLEPLHLLHDKKISNIRELLPILEQDQVRQIRLIIAEESGRAVATLV